MSCAVGQKLLVYCPDSTNREALSIFTARGYRAIALTDDPKTFWESLNGVGISGTFVLYSHGDKDGLLVVKGTDGNSLTSEEISRFGNILAERNITLYLISCETGAGSFNENLAKTNAVYVAPLGSAKVESTSSSLMVYSVDPSDNHKKLGWVGNEGLKPKALHKSLDIK